MLASYKEPKRGVRTWLSPMTVFSSFRAFLASGADLPAGCRSLQSQGKALMEVSGILSFKFLLVSRGTACMASSR